MQPPNLSNSLDLVQMTPLISTVWIVNGGQNNGPFLGRGVKNKLDGQK